MRPGRVLSVIVGAVALILPASVFAGPITHTGSLSFTSDLEPSGTITIPAFDTQGGTHTLVGVLVELFHSGSADIGIDNDDAFRAADAGARIVREWTLSGPGFSTSGVQTISTGVVHLAVDNGDGAAFDTSGPDGTSFGSVSYADAPAGTFNLNPALYAADGGGTLTFTITPTYIFNELYFTGRPPNQYQASVQNTNLTVGAKVTYTVMPEPATLAMLGLGTLGTMLLRRRRP